MESKKSIGTIDPFYRYKYPALKIKTKNNLTELLNLSDVCKKINRKESYILQYFKYKLGTNVQKINSKFIIRGIFDIETLNCLINCFVNDYVNCNFCNNPETVFELMFTRLFKRCKACGNLFRLSNNIDIEKFMRYDLLYNKK